MVWFGSGNDVGRGTVERVSVIPAKAGIWLPLARARTSFRRISPHSVGLCRFLSTARGGELSIGDCGIADCRLHGVSLGCGLDGVVWIRHRFMVVRGFCFVKFGAGEIPAFAGMTETRAGMTEGQPRG